MLNDSDRRMLADIERRSCAGRRAARGYVPVPKATGVSTRTMELLRTWGIEHRVRAATLRQAG